MNRNSGRHMAIQGRTSVEPIFDELETELSEAVPRAVVEAHRRFTRSGFYTLDDITDAEDYRI